ncbi:MAG: hypothetical protein WBP81_20950 [Solirubrobacteraceae bacterium]
MSSPFIAPFRPNPSPLATTVPSNGDVNPYGMGASTGAPGTAPVLAQIDPASLPGPCPGGVGLTTALAVTRTAL